MAGKKNPLVSFLCGVLGRRKQNPDEDNAAKKEDSSEDSSRRSGDALNSPKDPESPTDPSRDGINGQATATDEQPLPPPPGRLHNRTVSYHHDRSHTITSKLASSMSMKLPGNVNGMLSRQISRLEEKAANFRPDKKMHMKHEESLWKKQIILGERNKVPAEGNIVYDENGNKIPTYHQRSNSTALSISRADADPSQDSSKI